MPDPYLPDRRDFDPKDPNPCAGCSNCCEYIALEIDTPTNMGDYDQLVWFLIHKDVHIYVDEDNIWHIQFNTPCEKLDNQRCGYYPHRPQICRDYEPEECVRYGEGEPEKWLFKNEVDLFRFMAKRRPKMFEKLKKKNDIPFTREQLLSDALKA